MIFRNWLASVRSTPSLPRPTSSRAHARHTQSRLVATIENLEPRTVLTTIDLATLTASEGAIIYGAESARGAGWAVSDAGDVNGDGFDDVLVTSLQGFTPVPEHIETVYLIFGQGDWSTMHAIDLANLGSRGVAIPGIDARDYTGSSVSGVGDVNGDGFDDLIIGAHLADGLGNSKPASGESYLIFGKADWSATPTINLGALGSAGITFFGSYIGNESGFSVNNGGDINGDGFDDLLIGAPRASGGPFLGIYNGESYVVFGKADWSATPTIDLAQLSSAGVRIFGTDRDDFSGWSVSSAGDVNGDGFDDIFIGTFLADGAGNAKSEAGESYLIFGKADWSTTPSIQLAIFRFPSTQGIVIYGANAGDRSGSFLSNAGDVNGDGFDDILIGSPDANNYSGACHLVFGKADWSATQAIDLANLGSAGVMFSGTRQYDSVGRRLSGAGDVNSDGFDDLLLSGIGFPPGDFSDLSSSYLIFGKADWISTGAIELENLGASGINIIEADSGDGSGNSVSGAGDVNGDGFDDLLIGADNSRGANKTRFGTGEAYVIFGGNSFTNSVTHAGTTASETLTGSNVANTINGAGGNDTLIGNGGADVIYGGEGEDFVAISDVTFQRLDGGNGTDTLRLDGAGIRLDLTTLADNKLTDIEVVDLTGTGNNTLTLNQLEVLNLSSISNTLLVIGNIDDTVIMGRGWARTDDELVGANAFAVFAQGTARLKIQTTVTTREFGPVFDLSTLDGTNGFRLDGIDMQDVSGRSVSIAGDVNGDGFDDLIIGARGGDPNGDSYAGECYVVFGKSSGFAAALDLSTLDGTNGFRLDGIDADDRSGQSVSSAGDVNGDGFDDLLIGAYFGNPNGTYRAGESYLAFGKSSGFEAALDLSTLDGTNGFRLNGIDVGDFSCGSVSNAGDVNGDGFDDLLIGAPGGDPSGDSYAGESYVVFGKASGFGATLELSTLNGINGFRLDGIDEFDGAGASVASAGDVNGDGIDDLLIGAPGGDPNGKSGVGESYVVFGKSSGFAAPLDLSTLNGTNGFRIDGIDPGDASGASVSSVGDVNGDGFDDLLIGAPGGDPNGNNAAGKSYVVFGKSSSFGAALDLSTLNGTNGFRLDGIDEDDRSGRSVSSAGDVNGDGFDDLLIGAYFSDPNGFSHTGQSYVVFGKSSGFGAVLGLSTLDGTNGFRLDAIAPTGFFGRSVSSAGDVNGDGFGDLLIGAPYGASSAGESYVVFGGNFTGYAETQVGTNGANMLTANQGAGAKDVLIGHQGADTLLSDGGNDVLYGGEGNDTLTIASTAFQRVDGGNGSDTLRIDRAGVALNLMALADNKLTSIETIDLRGTGANSLTLNVLEVLNITSGSNAARTANTLIVRRDSDDLINIGTGWSQGANVIFGSNQFQTFTQGQAKLHVEIPVLITATLDGGRIVVRAPQGIALDVVVSRDAGTQEFVVGSRTGNMVTTEFRFPVLSVTGGLEALLSPQADRFDASMAGLPVTVDGGDGNDSLTGGTANDQLSGGNGDDTLTGGLGQNTLLAGSGNNDLLFEIFNADLTLTSSQLTVVNGDGTVIDSLSGFEKALILGGGSANRLDAALSGIPVTLFGGGGNDVLIGGNQADSLDGQGGNDTLTGGAGADSVLGGAGNDLLKEVFDQNLTLTNTALLAAGNGQVSVTDKLTAIELADLGGGISRNKIDLSGFAASLGATVNGNGQSDTIIGSPGPDMIITLTGADVINGLGGADIVFSGSGNDTISGGDGFDNISGQNGDDLISGDAGNDVLVGGVGRDTLDGGADSDFLSGQADPGLLNGGDGNDILQGSTANDTLNGDAGDDRLLGLQNNDVLNGGVGADTLFGGIGNDTLAGGAGTDDLRGESGSDTIDGGADADRINEVLDTNVTIAGTATASSITTAGFGSDTITNVERINLTGGAAANFFDARNANLPVLLMGDEGHDTLLGGSKSDIINGGAGNDVLSGGGSNDLIEGGDGTDYVLEKGDTNFTVNGVTITSIISGTETPANIERIALIGGLGANKLDASLATVAVVLVGGGGNDTLLGGSQADTLSGGNRNDSTVAGSDGVDSLDGGAGADVLENDTADFKALGGGDTTVANVFALLPTWVDAL